MGKKPLINKWYIVNLHKKSKNGKYFIFKASFNTKKEAKVAIRYNFPDRELYYEVVSGKESLHYGFIFKSLSLQETVLKYDYPPELETLQARKSFRTKYRRWKRTFNKELKKTYSAEKPYELRRNIGED